MSTKLLEFSDTAHCINIPSITKFSILNILENKTMVCIGCATERESILEPQTGILLVQETDGSGD